MPGFSAAVPGSSALQRYVLMVTASGAAVVAGLAWVAGPSELVGTRTDLFWCFLGLFTVVEARPLAWLRRDEGGEVTASWTFAVALLLIAPPAGVVLGIAAACLLGDVLRRKRLVRGLFNAANYSLSLGIGAVVLELTGERTTLVGGDPSVRWFVAFLLTAAVVVVLNSVLTSAVLALAQNLPTWPLVRAGVSRNVATDAMLIALAPVLVVVSQRSLTFVPFLLLTIWAVHRSVELALARQHEATHDSLTDLPNRGLFVEQAASACQAAGQRDQSVAVVLVDLEHLKAVIDHLGGRIRDLCLLDVAARLRAAARTSDLVARIGGDDFAVLVTGLVAGDEAADVIGPLTDALQAPCVVEGVPVAVRATFGIAAYPQHGEEIESLLRNADHAVYQAKRSHSPVVTYEASKDERRHNRWDLIAELPEAMRNGQLTLHHQPKLHVGTGRLVGCEALVRWEHPRFGMVPPGRFMPFAENTELIHPLTEHILRMALTQSERWTSQGLCMDISVNASTRNLHDLHFPEVVARLLDEVGVAASALELEITENTVTADPVRSATVLAALREQGIRIAFDDFGTGYSSLAHLRDLAIDAIKIDRSFITDMASRHEDRAIVGAIVDVARDLELETVAEGIETVAAWDELVTLGCGYGQGFLIARPLPAAEMTAWAQALPGGVWQPEDLGRGA